MTASQIALALRRRSGRSASRGRARSARRRRPGRAIRRAAGRCRFHPSPARRRCRPASVPGRRRRALPAHVGNAAGQDGPAGRGPAGCAGRRAAGRWSARTGSRRATRARRRMWSLDARQLGGGDDRAGALLEIVDIGLALAERAVAQPGREQGGGEADQQLEPARHGSPHSPRHARRAISRQPMSRRQKPSGKSIASTAA